MTDVSVPTPPALPGSKIDVDFANKGDHNAASMSATPATEEDPRQGLPPTVAVVEPAPGQSLPPVKFTETAPKVDPKGQYIKYIGVATLRVMGPKEWAAAGVNSTASFEWNYLNKKRIPRSAFTDEQLQYLLRVDDRFQLVTEE
jgi:hypothetical protein